MAENSDRRIREAAPGRLAASLVTALSLLGAACATAHLPPRLPASAEVVTADVPKLGIQSGEADLTLRVSNGRLPLAIDSAEVSLDLQGSRVTEALLAIQQRIPPKTAEAVQVRVPLALRTIPPAANDRLRRGEEMELVVRGVLKGTAGDQPVTLPFEALRKVHPKQAEPAGEEP